MTRNNIVFVTSLMIALWAGEAHAQSALSSRIMLSRGESPALAMMQARVQARAAKLRSAWKAAGHAEPEAAVAPEIVSGSILTSSLNVDLPGAAPKATVTYKTGASSLSYVELYFYSNNSSQVYYLSYDPYYYATASTHGTATFSGYAYPLGLYSAAGTWTLGFAYVVDYAGNYTYYNSTQLATLFSKLTFNVTSRYQDIVNPTISAGKVLTSTVSESAKNPVFKLSITAADHGSGLGSVFALVEPPGAGYGYEVYGDTALPAATATIPGSLYMSGLPTGTWTIYGYGACAVAGNCLYDYNSADVQALFGTTSFTVTN